MTDCLDRLPIALAAVAPRVNPSVWTHALLAPMRSSGMITPHRAAMFTGHSSEESGGFMVLVENLDYSATGLRRMWPTHFAPAAGQPTAESYARQPERIANHVYAYRLGNGDESSGDGWRFRGSGLIQLTGRTYWARFGASVGRSPEDAWTWAQTPEGAAAAACWYWLDRGQLLALSDAWEITEVTQRINGALTNLSRRITLCNAALAAFSAADAPRETPPAPTADELMAAEQSGQSFPLKE